MSWRGWPWPTVPIALALAGLGWACAEPQSDLLEVARISSQSMSGTGTRLHIADGTERLSLDRPRRAVEVLEAVQEGVLGEENDAIHAAALLDVVSARDIQSVDRSIATLRALLRRGSDTASILSDLVVAYEARATLSGAEVDWVAALDYAERAHDAVEDARSTWNREVLLERFGLDTGRTPLGEDRARLQPDSARAAPIGERTSARLALSVDEAAAELARLVDEGALDSARVVGIAAAFPKVARETAFHQLLPAWAVAWREDDASAASRTLGSIMLLGGGIQQRSGDTGLLIEVERLTQETVNPVFAVGYEAYARAEAAFSDGRFEAMAAEASAAVRALAGTESVVLPWAEYLVAIDHFQAAHYDLADRAFERILDDRGSTDRASLRGRALWGRGLVAVRLNRRGAALQLYQEAASELESSAEAEYTGGIQALIVELLARSGDRTEAWNAMGRTLDVLRSHHDSHLWANALRRAADMAAEDGWLDAAIALQREGLAVAERTGRVQHPIEARINLGRLLAASGRGSEAHGQWNAAERDLSGVPDARMQERVRIDLTAERTLAAWSRPDVSGSSAAVDSISAVLEYFHSADVGSRSAVVLAQRARMLLALGDTSAATADLEAAVAWVRDALAGLGGAERLPIPAAEGVTTALVELLAEAGRAEAALEVSDVARAVQLGTHTAGEVPTGRALEVPTLAFLTTEDALLTWRLDRPDLELKRLPIRRTEFVDAIASLRGDLIAGRAPDSSSAARTLSQNLLAPWFTDLPNRIDIVPDGLLGLVPWAALPVGAGSELLVDRTAVRLVPSLRHLGRPPAEVALGHPRVLLATGGSDLAAGLATLPGATEEVRAITARWQEVAQVDAIAEPSTTEVAAALPGSRIFHFAGHAQLGRRAAESHLVLQDEGPIGSRRVTPNVLKGLDLSGLETVVLASCRTLDSEGREISGLPTFAAAFMGAGARNVIGSLWSVRDRPTAALMADLHDALAQGAPSVEALAIAQRRSKARDGSRTWAAFQVIGW